ncbi:coproporphyrinogen III oxidase [Vibrio cholerae]|nr:coproporphyrinogen III oxidase [Vibrio cholerae]
MNGMLLASVGGAIIVALASHAAYLLWQVKKQQALQRQQQQLAIEKRNAKIFDSVNILCMAGIQGQCDLSEISIRVYCIMDYVQGEQRINFEQEYPAISELYHVVKNMPRGEARQQLPKQERMKQNLERTKAESRLQDAIIVELTALKQRIQPLNNQIAIQMV